MTVGLAVTFGEGVVPSIFSVCCVGGALRGQELSPKEDQEQLPGSDCPLPPPPRLRQDLGLIARRANSASLILVVP